MRHLSTITFLTTASLLLAACTEKNEEQRAEKNEVAMIGVQSNAAEVTVMKLEPRMFTHEVVSNGKIAAGAYADLRFTTSGAPIEKIMVKNGQRVRKGDVLAVLDRFQLTNNATNARNNLERARLDLADALIGQGYDPAMQETVPEEVMALSRLRSGVAQAEINLAEAEKALHEATMRAPFDGVVANMFQKACNYPDGAQPFCRILSTSGMEVDFTVLESELPLIHIGDAVKVSPYASDGTFNGTVSAVNPIVESDGMVKVTATVGSGTGLFDGMNVQVSVKREVEQALVVPKSSVVLRSGGRQVVFTHHDGKALWNYVTTSLENMNEYVVTDGLQAGAEVITTGNLNLAHEAPVKIISD